MKDLKSLITKYEDNGGGSNKFKDDWKWFSLKNDGDTAKVRFLIKGEEDILELCKEVHRIEINGYTNKVLCLEDKCEICKSGENASLRIFIPLYNVDKGELQIWERGVNDIKELMNLLEEYGDLDARDYKIKRKGKANSTSTTYSFLNQDKSERAELEEWKSKKPQLVGRNYKYVLDLSAPQQIEALNGTLDLTKKKDDVDYGVKADAGEETF